MTIGVVLFDADGVIQRTAGDWRERFAAMLDDATHLDAFVAEIFASERPCLTGAVDFPTQLGEVLRRWHSRTHGGTGAARSGRTSRSTQAVVELIRALRRSGVTCCLASNQQTHRARYMSGELGYRSAVRSRVLLVSSRPRETRCRVFRTHSRGTPVGARAGVVHRRRRTERALGATGRYSERALSPRTPAPMR